MGAAISLMPGVGLLVGSTIAYTLLTSGMCSIAGGLVGLLTTLDVMDRQTKEYTDLATQGGYLLIVTGTEAEIFCAEHILYTQGICQ